MTDEELAAALAAQAGLNRRTAEGVRAMFELAARLENERPEFAGKPPRMVISARGSHAFSGQFVAQAMLHMVRKGSAPMEAVAWLRKADQTTRAVGGAVKALYGITCAQHIRLSDDITLLPFSDLPSSETSEWMLAEHERANESLVVHGFRPPPAAALYRPGTVEPVFIGTDFAYTESSPPATWFDELDTAASLLAVTPGASPTEAGHWFHCEDPDVARLCQLGFRRNVTRDTQLPFGGYQPTEISPELTTGLLTAYRKLGEKDQDRVMLALRRLIRSRHRHTLPGDRAIDLAIALEVLFMGADRDEHSYKISLRLARVLGGDLPDKRRAFRETHKLYELRSNMVHSGRAKNEWTIDKVKRTAYDLVEAGDVRCAQAIRAFIARGSIPTGDGWRDIELP